MFIRFVFLKLKAIKGFIFIAVLSLIIIQLNLKILKIIKIINININYNWIIIHHNYLLEFLIAKKGLLVLIIFSVIQKLGRNETTVIHSFFCLIEKLEVMIETFDPQNKIKAIITMNQDKLFILSIKLIFSKRK